jgi:LysM repeat protein
MRRVVGGCLLVLAISACGRGGGDDETAAIETTVATTAPITTAPTTVPPPQDVRYVVQQGDSLSAIADRFGVSVEEIANANAIEDVHRISVGQELVIPPSTTTVPPAPGAGGDTTTNLAGATTTTG